MHGWYRMSEFEVARLEKVIQGVLGLVAGSMQNPRNHDWELACSYNYMLMKSYCHLILGDEYTTDLMSRMQKPSEEETENLMTIFKSETDKMYKREVKDDNRATSN